MVAHGFPVGKFVHNRDILLTTAARMGPNIMH